MTHPREDRLLGYGLVLIAAACWSTGGLMAKWLFSTPGPATAAWPVPPLGLSIAPTTLSAARALAAAVILLVLMAIRTPALLRVRRRDLPFLAVFGAVGLAGVHYTYFKTISLTDVATAILLEYLAPVIVLAISVVFLGKRFTPALPIGAALSITGCALVVGIADGGLRITPTGLAWGLASAVFFAAYSLMGSYATSRFDPLQLLSYGLVFASLLWLVALGPEAVLGVFADPKAAAAVLAVAVVSTIVPFLAFLNALHHIGPTQATVTATVEPVLAGIAAFFLFDERLGFWQLTGAALVIAAIVLVSRPSPARIPPV